MELFGWNEVTMRNVSTSLWYAVAWKWDKEREEAKDAEEKDSIWKMEDDFSNCQTLREWHSFQGNLVSDDENSPLYIGSSGKL